MQQFFYSLHYHHINVIFQTVSSTTDCMQCAKYQDGIQVYSGIMNMHQQNHLHNLGTYVPECKQPNAGLAQTKPPSPQYTPFRNLQQNTHRFYIADMSLLQGLCDCMIPHLYHSHFTYSMCLKPCHFS